MNITNIDDVLSSFPALSGDAETTDSDILSDLKPWAIDARTLLEQACAVIAERDVAVAQVTEARAMAASFEAAARLTDERNAELVEFVTALTTDTKREIDGIMQYRDKLDAGVSRIQHALGLAPGGGDFDVIVDLIHLHRDNTTDLADRDAQIEALEVDVSLLEDHVDRLGSELNFLMPWAELDYWIDWDEGDELP